MKKKINKNSLIYKWANDKNPVNVCGKSSKNKIEIKYVEDINAVLKKKDIASNEHKN